jgi:UDP-GlcNAc:undecaprenyl-phosphate/decaprenyl-phosphate GlcNAc-1-phosphate transferase
LADFLPLVFVGFAASVGLTPLTRRFAQRIGLVDKPSKRKVHSNPTPLMGGLAIYGAFVLALLLFSGNAEIDPQILPQQHTIELIAIVIGATWLAIVGFIDDRYELKPRQKYAAQFLAAAGVMLVGIRIDLFRNPMDWLLTFVWIVGLINAVNFLDNMDGLAAGVSAIAAFFLYVLSASQGQELVSMLSAALCGAAVGFLIYNFNPATTFMGDMGSMVLGFLLAVMGIKLRFPGQPLETSWLIPILVLGLPIFDTTLVVFTRLREGRSPAQGGKDHTSHRLQFLGLSTRYVVLSLYAVCVLFGIAAVAISRTPVQTDIVIGIGVAVVAWIAFLGLEYVRLRQVRSQLQNQAHSQK